MSTVDELCDRVACVVEGSIVALDTPAAFKIARSQRGVRVQYRTDTGGLDTAEFGMGGLGADPAFHAALSNHHVETIHSRKAIDLVLDMGCYHSLPKRAKPIYVGELAAVLASGTPLVMWQGIRLRPGEIPAAFERDFVIESVHRKDSPIRRTVLRHTITGHWYQLRRR